MKRVLDATRINLLANDPSVRPYLGGDGPVDLNPVLGNPDVYLFESDGGAGLLVSRLFGTRYSVHSIFTARLFREFLDLSYYMLEYLFTRTDCEEIVSTAQDNNRGALSALQRMGFVVDFKRGDTTYWKLPLDTWARVCSTAQAQGALFHDQLEVRKAESGSSLVTHEDDDAHDHTVGGAILMAKAGRGIKGVDFYNRWAVFAGYAPIRVVSEAPFVIDIGDAVIEFTGGEMEILQCR